MSLCLQVLKWVEEAVQSSKVHLLSTDHHTGVSNTWQIPFDPSLKEVTVALSGPAPDIEILDPQGSTPYRVFLVGLAVLTRSLSISNNYICHQLPRIMGMDCICL